MAWKDDPVVGSWSADPVVGESVDPTEGMSIFELAAAGAGKAVADVGRGIGQWFNLVDRKDVEESRKRDAALMKRGPALAGNVAGSVAMLAPTALIPGAATIPGAAVVGALAGAAQPSVSNVETASNIGLGAAGGAAGQWVAGKLSNALGERLAQRAAQQAQRLPVQTAAREAIDAGYVIPPSDVRPGGAVELLSGLSGKIKTAQEASARNQQVTNSLVRQALGVAPDEPLTRETLLNIRRNAGQAYEAFKNVGTVQADDAFNNALDAIVSKYQGAARSFPDLVSDDPITKRVMALKQPTFDAGDAIDATKVLRDASDRAFGSGDKATATALKKASDALEDVLERHLSKTGDEGLLKAFREARKGIAKTYSVEKALNPVTGDVSAPALAQQFAKNRPLSGELLDVAKAAAAFPKATQMLKESPKTFSPLDFATAGLGFAGSGGSPLATIGLLARPASRSVLLSRPMQSMALRPLPDQTLGMQAMGLLSRPSLSLPAGVGGGLLFADGLQ